MGTSTASNWSVFSTPLDEYRYGSGGYGGGSGITSNPTLDAYRTQGGQAGFAGLTQGFDALEQKARNASGYGDLYSNTTLGMVPQATMDDYWNRATDEAYNKSKGAYASMFGEAGMPAMGVGGQTEMLSRRAGELATQRARANVENAQRGASTQAQAQTGIATNRYNQYMKLLMDYYAQQLNPPQNTSRGGGGVSIAASNPFSRVKESTLTSPWDYLQKPSENLISWGGGYQTSPYEVPRYNWEADETPRG